MPPKNAAILEAAKTTNSIRTLSMARALGLDQPAGGSLAALAKHMRSLGYAIPEKGDEVTRALGKRRADFTPQELARYGDYCCTDTDICHGLFHIMAPLLPVGELVWHDIAIRMAACPILRLNRDVLVADLKRVRERKAELMATLGKRLGVQSVEQLETVLASNEKFALMLEFMGGALPWAWFATPGRAFDRDDEGGVRYGRYLQQRHSRTGGVPLSFDIPVKPSPSNPSKLTSAFAKADEGLMELAESGNTLLESLVAARLGVKSLSPFSHSGITQDSSRAVPVRSAFSCLSTFSSSGA